MGAGNRGSAGMVGPGFTLHRAFFAAGPGVAFAGAQYRFMAGAGFMDAGLVSGRLVAVSCRQGSGRQGAAQEQRANGKRQFSVSGHSLTS